MPTSDEHRADDYLDARSSLEDRLTQRLCETGGFDETSQVSSRPTREIMSLAEGIVSGLAEDRLVELSPTLIEHLDKHAQFHTETLTETELARIGANLERCHERYRDKAIASVIVQDVTNHIETLFAQPRRRRKRAAGSDLRHCSLCKVALLSHEVEQELLQWSPRFLERYETTVRKLSDAPIDPESLLQLLFRKPADDEAPIETLNIIPVECRELFVGISAAAGMLRTAIDAGRADVAADIVAILDNLDIGRFVQSDAELERFLTTEDDPAFEAALDHAYEVSGYGDL